MEIATTTGIFLDPVYTGKAVKGLLNEVKTNPQRFKGKRLLYIHTGIFAIYISETDARRLDAVELPRTKLAKQQWHRAIISGPVRHKNE